MARLLRSDEAVQLAQATVDEFADYVPALRGKRVSHVIDLERDFEVVVVFTDGQQEIITGSIAGKLRKLSAA